MADVFLSYARADREVAERLADAIQQSGRTVWWDRHIKGGSEFSRDIEQELADAGHVLVLWSKDAVESRWVRDEASEAAESGRLVAATLDGTPPPLGFRQFHTIDLSSWTRKGAELPAELAEALGTESLDNDPSAGAGSGKAKRGLLIAIAVFLFIGLAGLIATRDGGLGGLFERSERRSVSLAVLPFAAPAGDQSFLGAGLAGALANSLSQLQGLNITSITSTQSLASKSLTAKDIGKRLGVTHFVEGEIRPDGDQVHAAVRLIDARTSTQLWSKVYDGLASDLGALQDRIGSDLGAALRARLGVGHGAIASGSGIDPRAYEAYLKGIERLSVRYEVESRQEALRQFQLATAIQPDFADAYAGAAYLLSLSVPEHFPMTWAQIKSAQRKANAKALELDPDNLLALVARSNAAHNFDGDVEASFRDARKVLDIAPDFGPAHYSLASTYIVVGDSNAALPHFDQAIANDPFNKIIRVFRAVARYQLRDYKGVRSEALECEGDCTNLYEIWFDSLVAHGSKDDLERNADALFAGLRDWPDEIKKEARGAARGVILGQPFPMKPPLPTDRGFGYASLLAAGGRIDDAFRVARYTAPRSQADQIVQIMADGRLDFAPELRADPRYHALFRDFPHLSRIADARRRNGVLAGLPIQPAQIAAEKERLASLRR